VKNKIRWRTPAWTTDQCAEVADAVLDSARRHDLSPSLIVAVMINESDMNEKAVRPTMHGKTVYAKDSGLMGVRCVLDKKERCTNGNVRGMSWKELMTPAGNIEAGARELAYWKNGGAVTRAVVKVRDEHGRIRPVYRERPCRHKTHAWWAHYNHGPRYIEKGFARHYPHRIAVLYHALATVTDDDQHELVSSVLTIQDPGRRPRTADHPVEARHKKLYEQIMESAGGCSRVAVVN
jgi:hypothetical protein